MTGGTTQGLAKDPFADDGFTNQLNIETIFQELDQNHVSWKIYYSVTAGGCTDEDGDCGAHGKSSAFPVTTFSDFTYSSQYLYENPQKAACTAPTVGSQQAVRRFLQFILRRPRPHRTALPIYDRRRQQYAAQLCVH